MKYGTDMTRLLVCVLCLLECAVSVWAVRYGEYSAGHMPQYSEQREDGEAAPAPAHDDYDRSPDAPAHLDYKYEEEPHGKSDDFPVKDIVDDRIWEKPIKKKKKPFTLRSGRNRDLDKYSLDDPESEVKSGKRIALRGYQFINRKRSESQKQSKHAVIAESDDMDNVENDSNDVLKQGRERADADDMLEVGRFPYRFATQKKPRRKPRDRALDPRDWRDANDNIKADEVDSRPEIENFEMKHPRRLGGIIQESMNRKNKNYDYDDYYDMKRVQHMKGRLPALLKQTTVRTTEAMSASYFEHWVNRRAGSLDTPSESEHGAATDGTTEPTTSTTTTTTTTTTPTTTTNTTGMTSETKSTAKSSSELSLAEKSRLSILKKAHRKESSRNASSSSKPPVLMQVTRKMQTLVMVERRPGEPALRARDVQEDSPERLRRARRLVRHKLVAGARSIHDLIDNWDEMICDYIDVSLLDTDAASYLDIDMSPKVLLCFVSLFIVNYLF